LRERRGASGTIMHQRKSFFSDIKGVTSIEYGLIAACVGLAVLLTIQAVGLDARRTLNAVRDALDPDYTASIRVRDVGK
jgi:Flp pilus assembly pilin Flp